MPPPADAIDLGDALLAPGFVDIQVNGADAVDFASASVDEIVAKIDERVAGGCTACLPTICTAPLDAYAPMLDRLAAVRAARPDAVLGVHLEGPFLGGAPGAHPVDLVRPVELDWLADLCDRFGDLVRLVTLAPEADPGLAATAMLHDRGVVVALGHSTVDYDGARARPAPARDRHAPLQRDGPVAPSRARPGRRRARRPSPGAVDHRRRRARASGAAAGSRSARDPTPCS